MQVEKKKKTYYISSFNLILGIWVRRMSTRQEEPLIYKATLL